MRVIEERETKPVRSTPSAAKRFSDALLGRTCTQAASPPEREGVNRPSRPEQSRLIENFRWLMAIMPSRAGLYQQQLEVRLAEEESVRSESSTFAELILEADWDASKHPRRGSPPNGGWFADKGTGTTATGGDGAASGKELRVAPVSYESGKSKPVNKGTLNDLVNRQRKIDNLAGGGPSRQKMHAQGIAGKITSAGKLPGAIAGGLGSGAKTGGKALINGGATAVKNVATLGLSTSQLELIGVTEEDRANGYDTAVAIATASGEVLITVGTGGIAAALKNGGTVARAANGALVVHDAAGSAVGVVQGIYDAKENGVTVSGGASIAANALGLSSDLRGLSNSGKQAPAAPLVPTAKSANVVPQQPSKGVGHQPSAPNVKYRVGPHKDMPSPRNCNHSHHAVISAWMRRKFAGYDEKKAPTVLMPAADHEKTYGVFNKWKTSRANAQGGDFDWEGVTEDDMRELSEAMFDAAQVPAEIRKEYWVEFDKMKEKLNRSTQNKLEAVRWARSLRY